MATLSGSHIANLQLLARDNRKPCFKISHHTSHAPRTATKQPIYTICQASRQSNSSPQYAEWSQSIPPNQPSYLWSHPMSLTLTGLLLLEGAALIGAIVGGVLARKRRNQLEETNQKLRMINQELRRQREATIPDDLGAYRTALEKSLGAPSAAHPVETYGNLKTSLARARRQIEESIREAKGLLHDSSSPATEAGAAALPLLADALLVCKDIKDLRAERAVVRLRARALRATGDLEGSFTDLQRVLELSKAVGDKPEEDADTLGEMGDVLAEMGNFERAGKFYDLTITAIQGMGKDSNGGNISTWDAA